MRVLYLTVNGLMEPLGQGQVLAYLKELAGEHTITVVSFEKDDDLADVQRVARVAQECKAEGIRWVRYRFWRRGIGLGPLWNLTRLAGRVVHDAVLGRVDLIHARSYIPAACALLAKRLTGVPFIFDMRAHWPEALVAAGRLKRDSGGYRILKWIEDRCLIEAAFVVCLTQASRSQLATQERYAHQRFAVIPTCADLDRFAQAPPSVETRVAESVVVGCVGSVDSPLFRLDWVLRIFKSLSELRPGSSLRFVTRSDPEVVMAEAAREDVAKESVEAYSRPFEEMPDEIRRMDVGVFFYTAGPFDIGRSPTRMAEFLGCGVPLIANPGVGDVESIIRDNRIGVIVDRGDDSAMREAAQELLELLEDPDVGERCRLAAERQFSLSSGVESYRALYAEVATTQRT